MLPHFLGPLYSLAVRGKLSEILAPQCEENLIFNFDLLQKWTQVSVGPWTRISFDQDHIWLDPDP
jgi:hypothetical protein